MRSMSKTSLVMTRLIPHHPTHFLNVIGDAFARYLLLTSLTVIHIHTIFLVILDQYMCKIIPQKCILYQITLLKLIHNERNTSKFLDTVVRFKQQSTEVRFKTISLHFYGNIFNFLCIFLLKCSHFMQ